MNPTHKFQKVFQAALHQRKGASTAFSGSIVVLLGTVTLLLAGCGRGISAESRAWLYDNASAASGTTFISATPTPTPAEWTPVPAAGGDGNAAESSTPNSGPAVALQDSSNASSAGNSSSLQSDSASAQAQTAASVISPTPAPVLPSPSSATPTPVLTPEPTPSPVYEEIPTTMERNGQINGNEVNFRQYPGTSALILNAYDRGKEVTILGYGDGWTKVEIDGYTGYIKSEYVIETSQALFPTEEATELAGNDEVSVFVDTTTIAATSASSLSSIAQRIIDLTNAERAANGLSALTYDSRLQQTADLRAQEQVSLFSHTRPDGSDWSTAFPTGVYYFLGENLAMCDGILTDESFASSCVKWWMNSEDHRANILNSSYTVIAVGVTISGSNMYAVQEFGTPY